MTTPYRRTARCPNCNYDIPLEDEISQWIRSHPELDSAKGFAWMDKDLICHRFLTNHGRDFQCMMFVEFKTRGARLNDVQRDTMHMVNQMFRTDCTTPTKRARDHSHQTPTRIHSVKAGRRISAKAFGYHLVLLSGQTPDDSAEIWWDKTRIDRHRLIQLLRFDLNPDSLQPMDWRIHHAPAPSPCLPL